MYVRPLRVGNITLIASRGSQSRCHVLLTVVYNQSVETLNQVLFPRQASLMRFHTIRFSYPLHFFSLNLDVELSPVNATSSAITATTVRLNWPPLDSRTLGETVSNYQIEITDLLRGERFNYTVNSSTNVQLDFLKPFTRYEFKVFGSTEFWSGNITDTISLTTQEDGKLQSSQLLAYVTLSEAPIVVLIVIYRVNGEVHILNNCSLTLARVVRLKIKETTVNYQSARYLAELCFIVSGTRLHPLSNSREIINFSMPHFCKSYTRHFLFL